MYSNIELDEDALLGEKEAIVKLAIQMESLNNEVYYLRVDLDAEAMLETIEDVFGVGEDNPIHLFDQDGHYLLADEDAKLYGATFYGQIYTFDLEYPTLAPHLEEQSSGYYDLDTGLLFYQTIEPVDGLGHWVLTMFVNEGNFTSKHFADVLGFTIYDFLILFATILVVFLINLVTYSKKKDSEQLFLTRKIAEETSDAVVISNQEQEIVYVNRAFEEQTGYLAKEVLGKTTRFLQSGLHDKAFYRLMWDQISQTGQWRGEVWDKKKNGLFFPKDLTIIHMDKKSSFGENNFVAISKDLTKDKEFENVQGGLYTRTNKIGNDTLANSITDSICENSTFFSLVLFQINNLNRLVLHRGHTYDQLRDQIVRNLTMNLDKEDFIAQIGKGQFLLGLQSMTSEEDLRNYMKKLLDTDLYKVTLGQVDYYLEIKAGIATYPNHEQSRKNLFHSVNIALQHVMNDTKESFSLYSPDMEESTHYAYAVDLALRNAMNKNELSMHYQAQYDSSNQTIIGYESLLRFASSKLGFVSPAIFIPIAEKNGLIIAIGYKVFEMVFQDFKELQKTMSKNGRVAINLSILQFLDDRLMEVIVDLAEKYQVDLGKVEIEITESIFAQDIAKLQKRLKELSGLGLSISIDDFGTGFSSLQYLQKLHIDRLKIDQSFIRDYPNQQSIRITEGIVHLANKLQIDVLCEGVETKEQAEFLQSIGCKNHQGYYYAKPCKLSDL